MTTTQQLAKHFRQVHFGGNWTCSNLKENLSDLTWEQATTKIADLNTIAVLTFHINYYISAVTIVLKGGLLNAKDADSFNLLPIENDEDWQALLQKTWSDAEKFTELIEQIPDEQLMKTFVDEKYGTYHRNLLGIIEHTHYHLGQIAIIKKLVLNKNL